jgi:hypothetical protein
MTTKYTKWTENLPTSSVARPFQICPNWDFWFENKPPGNPVRNEHEALPQQESISGLPDFLLVQHTKTGNIIPDNN